MILKMRPGGFELWAAFLDPLRYPSTVLCNQTLNVTNTLAFRNDAGIRQHFAAELDSGFFLFHSPHASF
jgi:hypothetical protein